MLSVVLEPGPLMFVNLTADQLSPVKTAFFKFPVSISPLEHHLGLAPTLLLHSSCLSEPSARLSSSLLIKGATPGTRALFPNTEDERGQKIVLCWSEKRFHTRAKYKCVLLRPAGLR